MKMIEKIEDIDQVNISPPETPVAHDIDERILNRFDRIAAKGVCPHCGSQIHGSDQKERMGSLYPNPDNLMFERSTKMLETWRNLEQKPLCAPCYFTV